jgi:hypothetical protein
MQRAAGLPRSTKHAIATAAETSVDFAKSLLSSPGAPITVERTRRAAGQTRKRINIPLTAYELRHALPAFAIEILDSGLIGEPELIHGQAVQSSTTGQSPQVPGWQGDASPFAPTYKSPAPFVFFLLSVVTTKGIAIPCGIEVVTNQHWRREGETVAADDLVEGISLKDQLRELAGRPEGWDLPETASELVGVLYDSLEFGERALDREGALTDLPLAGGWLYSPPSARPALGYALLAESLAPLYELKRRDVFTVLDVCAAEGSIDLRSLSWQLEIDAVAWAGRDLHEALRAGSSPWRDVTGLAPPGPADVRWYMTRGVTTHGAARHCAALLATRDLRGRRIHGAVRVCLDALESDELVRVALRVADADAYELHRPQNGPLQALREVSHEIGAFHVQAQKATPREPVMALALMAVGCVLVARHANSSLTGD